MQQINSMFYSDRQKSLLGHIEHICIEDQHIEIEHIYKSEWNFRPGQVDIRRGLEGQFDLVYKYNRKGVVVEAARLAPFHIQIQVEIGNTNTNLNINTIGVVVVEALIAGPAGLIPGPSGFLLQWGINHHSRSFDILQ